MWCEVCGSGQLDRKRRLGVRKHGWETVSFAWSSNEAAGEQLLEFCAQGI